MFKENFIRLCARNGESPTAVCKKVGLSNAAYSGWTKESIPRMKTLKRIADYFGVAPEDLLVDAKDGKSDIFEKLTQAKKGRKNGENAAVGRLSTACFSGEVDACSDFTMDFVGYDEKEFYLYYSCVPYCDLEYSDEVTTDTEGEEDRQSKKTKRKKE